jgi:hypothetical protein
MGGDTQTIGITAVRSSSYRSSSRSIAPSRMWPAINVGPSALSSHVTPSFACAVCVRPQLANRSSHLQQKPPLLVGAT